MEKGLSGSGVMSFPLVVVSDSGGKGQREGTKISVERWTASVIREVKLLRNVGLTS